MSEEKRIAWHPAFVEAIQAELEEYKDVLEFQAEYPLTTEPLRIDVLIVKKRPDAIIEKNIARKRSAFEGISERVARGKSPNPGGGRKGDDDDARTAKSVHQYRLCRGMEEKAAEKERMKMAKNLLARGIDPVIIAESSVTVQTLYAMLSQGRRLAAGGSRGGQ